MNTAINVALHQGKVMNRLAKNYADLPAVIKEVVQNAIDSGASRISIQINLPQRAFIVYDNGSGSLLFFHWEYLSKYFFPYLNLFKDDLFICGIETDIEFIKYIKSAKK